VSALKWNLAIDFTLFGPSVGDAEGPGPSPLVLKAAGVELFHYFEKAQVIDFTNRQKSQNRYSRQSEVHRGYTDRRSGTDFAFGAYGAAA
jgi:hypothetical protein